MARPSVVLLFGLLAGGCPLPPGSNVDSNVDGDENNTFVGAGEIPFDADKADFNARINETEDTDFFIVGDLAIGDRIVIDVQTTSGDLDPVGALFDNRQYVHAFNDDREPDASNLNPRIDYVVRGGESPFFLGVTPFPNSGSTGAYRVQVTVTRGVGVPDPTPQIFFLNWAGGEDVNIDNVGVYNLDPFSATDLGPYFGRTDDMKDAIQNVVLDRFTGFNFNLQNSDDHPVPGTDHSTIYFGGSSRTAFAISEQIDTLNGDPTDNAIIFTRSFRGSFSTTPSLEEMATAVGNTVAHEIGHLIGLVHTNECSSLMDTTCGNDSILVDQAFELATLDDSVFPVGYQDAMELVGWALGFAGM